MAVRLCTTRTLIVLRTRAKVCVRRPPIPPPPIIVETAVACAEAGKVRLEPTVFGTLAAL